MYLVYERLEISHQTFLLQTSHSTDKLNMNVCAYMCSCCTVYKVGILVFLLFYYFTVEYNICSFHDSCFYTSIERQQNECSIRRVIRN